MFSCHQYNKNIDGTEEVGESVGGRKSPLTLMASLKKLDRSSIWYCQFYVTDPTTGGLKQVRKSTGETSKKKALARAIEMERAAKQTMASDDDEKTQLI